MDPRGFPTTLPEFQRVFPDEAACAAYLERLRWPERFTCPKCSEVCDPYRFTSRPRVVADPDRDAFVAREELTA